MYLFQYNSYTRLAFLEKRKPSSFLMCYPKAKEALDLNYRLHMAFRVD